jgi:AmiR/NasT family two-component response regulator
MTSERPHAHLRVFVADEDHPALDEVARLLAELDHHVIARAISPAEVSPQLKDEKPDVALVKLHDDDEHALELIDEIVQDSACPVIALLEVGEPDFISAAAEKGIFGYVQPVTVDKLQGAIDVAIRRYADVERLNEEVDQLEGALDRRAVIERAKGILMERHSLDERAAFEMLRSHARSNNRRLIEIARAVGDGHALLPKD